MPLRKSSKGSAWRASELWKRLLYGLVVAGLVSLLTELGTFAPIENPIEEFLFSGRSFGIPGLGLHYELLIIVLLALTPCLWRIDQPLLLIAYALCIGFVYVMIASIVLLTTERVLPVVPAMLGLMTSTIIVGSGAWGEERRKRKDLEQQDVARQMFTDMLVHDMKKRMSAILMSVSVLERKQACSAHQPIIDTIRASADRMLLLASNLLDIRRVEENRMNLDRQAVSLRNIVRETLSEHHFASDLTGIPVHMDEGADIRVNIDRSIFQRILSNLFWNALQHARADSTIHVACGRTPDKMAYVAIANRGEAIPDDVRAELFTAFVSGHSEPTRMPEASTGLGLTFCRLAMEAHDGVIELESPWEKHGDGVKVTVRLPAQ